MLTEEQRELIVEYFKQNVTYEYAGWNINPTIVRWGEGFDRKNPFITFNFQPTSRLKFRSISDVLGPLTEEGDYKDYGCCQIENMEVRCYANKEHKSRTINGRIIAITMANQIINVVLREMATSILHSMNASLEYNDLPTARDVSIWDGRKGTKMYIYEVDFKIRTQYRWNLIPVDYEGDVIAEDIEVLTINDNVI